MSARRLPPRARRWPYFGTPQRTILFAAIGIFVAAALPWAIVLGETLQGSPLAVAWTLWAGLMTLAGAIVPWRGLALLSAAAGGGTAIFFAFWQTARIIDRCPLSLDCVPGPGVGLLLVAGGAALYQAVRMARGVSER